MKQDNILHVFISKEPPRNTWCSGMFGRYFDVVDDGHYYLLAEDVHLEIGTRRGILKDFATELPPLKYQQFQEDLDKLKSGDYVLMPRESTQQIYQAYKDGANPEKSRNYAESFRNGYQAMIQFMTGTLRVRIIASQDELKKLNAPSINTGDIVLVKEIKGEEFYLLVEPEIKEMFWFAIPKSFTEVLP